MPFIVGAFLIVGGMVIAWGSISGRLAKMLAAIFASNELTAATPPPTSDNGFQQLTIPQVQVI